MSFVSKGEKTMHNMVKKGASEGLRAPKKDAFGAKGQVEKHNMAPGSKDKEAEPVSKDAGNGDVPGPEKVVKSAYDPASGKRAKSVADLRNAAKLLNERGDAGDDSPTGSEGGQDAKHSSSKNATGWMKTSKPKMEKPSALANQDEDAMEDPMDEDEEDSDQTKYGMTPSGQNRKTSGLKVIKRKIAEMS